MSLLLTNKGMKVFYQTILTATTWKKGERVQNWNGKSIVIWQKYEYLLEHCAFSISILHPFASFWRCCRYYLEEGFYAFVRKQKKTSSLLTCPSTGVLQLLGPLCEFISTIPFNVPFIEAYALISALTKGVTEKYQVCYSRYFTHLNILTTVSLHISIFTVKLTVRLIKHKFSWSSILEAFLYLQVCLYKDSRSKQN